MKSKRQNGEPARRQNSTQESRYTVSNMQEELVQWYADNARGNPQIIHATERWGAGIMHAIGNSSLGPNVSPRDISDSMFERKSLNPGHEVVVFYLFYERLRHGEVENSEQYVQYFKSIFELSSKNAAGKRNGTS